MFRAVLYAVSLILAAWLLGQLVHELGHVAGAGCAGATVERVVWHPSTISSTVRAPVGLIDTWGGIALGAGLPLLAWLALCRTRVGREARFFAGFCLVANGAYFLAGAPFSHGDPADLVALGAPLWVVLLTGFAGLLVGLWLWWDLARLLGWQADARPAWGRTLMAVAAATFVLALTLVLDLRGWEPS